MLRVFVRAFGVCYRCLWSVWVVELLSLALRKAGEIGNRCIRSQRGSNALLEIRRFPGSKWRLKKINIFGAFGPADFVLNLR